MRTWKTLCLIAAAGLVAGACGGSPPPASKTSEAVPPTAEAKPTAAPQTVDARAVIERLKARGMPIGETVVFTGDNDPNNLLGRPNQYTSKATFLDTRLARQNAQQVDADDGGTVEVFDREEDARARHAYVENLGKATPLLVQYGYVEGRALLRLSKRLSPAQAGQYEALLKDPSAMVTPVPAIAQAASGPSASAGEKPSTPAKVGDRAESGGVALTVNSAQRSDNLGQFFKAKPGRIYVVADVTIETVAGDKVSYSPAYFKAKDADGFEYTASLAGEANYLKTGELGRGEKVRGTVGFDVPSEAKGVVLSYLPIVPFASYETIRVALE